MANETTVVIVGNLVDKPEIRVTPSGVMLSRFTVASTPRMFDKQTNGYKDGDPLFMTCTAWRDLAEHVAESLDKGARVIVSGRLRLSRWETPEGEKRSMMQLDADEVGPSLRFATATVNKLTRSSGGAGTPAADPWPTATPATSSTPTTAGSSASPDWDGNEPPF